MRRLPSRAAQLELTELGEQTRMSYGTSWEQFAREEGLALGIGKGVEQGRQEGEARALLRLLAARFGPPTAPVVARVQAAPLAQLEDWFTRALTAERLDQVFDAL